MSVSDVAPRVSSHGNSKATIWIAFPEICIWRLPGRPWYSADLGAFTFAAAAVTLATAALTAPALAAWRRVRVMTPFHEPPIVQRSKEGSLTAHRLGGVPVPVSPSGILIFDERRNTAAG